MSFFVRFRLSWILYAAVFLSCALPVRADDGRGKSPEDSLLTAYYQQTKAVITTREGLLRCDTLFRRAEQAGWLRMQAIALCLELDHYYFSNDRERMLDAVGRVREFCLEHGKKELAYFYYFAWGSRLVTYYTKQNQFNVALYETRRMLAEAEADGYAQGVAECYRTLANIYLVQKTHDRAYENFRREIEVFERNGIEDINLPTQYASLAQCALELNRPDSALWALERGRALRPKRPYQQFTLDKATALYYLYLRDFEMAGRYVDSARMRFGAGSSMRPYRPGLRYLETEYYRTTGQYAKALESIDEALADTVQRNTGYLYHSLLREQGDIHFLRGDMRRSAESYRLFIRLSDSVRNAEIRSSSDDFSGILEIARLQTRTRELQLALQKKRLRSTYAVIGLLGLALLLGGLGYYRAVKLNRRLEESRAKIAEQNEHLLRAGEELRAAKENAEQASRMKSDFIQNMSHEVRTPLNSIMGFSQVLASKFHDDEAVQEYTSIIVSSSMNLLQMVDDVLDIAFLDQTDELPRTDLCSMNDSCHECVAAMLPHVKSRVTLVFEPSVDDPVVHTNRKRVLQIIRHLVHNAVKFTVDGEIILSYTCSLSERLMRFTVTDTGPGIRSGEHERVFERFVKLDSFAQGTGLGLPVCRIIAVKLGGRLAIDPDYTDGCRMVLEIPFDLPG